MRLVVVGFVTCRRGKLRKSECFCCQYCYISSYVCLLLITERMSNGNFMKAHIFQQLLEHSALWLIQDCSVSLYLLFVILGLKPIWHMCQTTIFTLYISLFSIAKVTVIIVSLFLVKAIYGSTSCTTRDVWA